MTTDDQIYSYYYAEKDRSLRTTLEIIKFRARR